MNISFINTIMYPLYDQDKYVLCKRSKIHLYLSYEIDLKTKKKAFEIEKQSDIFFLM